MANGVGGLPTVWGGGERERGRGGASSAKRGGARAGAGRPRKPLAEKIAEGNRGKRPLTRIEMPDAWALNDASEVIEGVSMPCADIPKPRAYLEEEQRDGTILEARDVYEKTYEWLKKYKCDHLVTQTIIEEYAMSVARWIQCERAVSQFGLLGKHPTSQNPIQSPFVAMGHDYLRQSTGLWTQIFSVVKENCMTEIQGNTPMDDTMEMLLRKRTPKSD